MAECFLKEVEKIMKTAQEIREEIAGLQQQLTHAVELEKKLDAADPQQVADAIHAKTCRLSHMDQCGYEYESWADPGANKKEYLDSANRLIAKAKSLNLPISAALEFIRWR